MSATNPTSTSETNLTYVNDRTFQEQVLASSQLTVVDFTAQWCPPCRALDPVYARLSGEFAGQMRFAKLDTDENPNSVLRYGIQGAPTLVFFKNGEEVERIVGPHPGRLRGRIEGILAEHA